MIRDTKEWYDGNYGVLNSSGIIVKAGKYDYIELLDNGLMLVCQNIRGANLYGIHDIDGKENLLGGFRLLLKSFGLLLLLLFISLENLL